MATPPNFTAGQVLTAAQMDKIGFWTVVPETNFSAVSAITRDNIFTTDFDNYRLIMTYSTSTTLSLNYQERASGSTANTLYYSSGLGATSGLDSVSYFNRVSNGSTIAISRTFNVAYARLSLDIFNPVSSTFTTTFAGDAIDSQAFINFQFGGGHNTATSYDGFTITTSTGTITGFYAVYGYNVL